MTTLAWVLRNPQVTSALVSAPSAPELRNLLRASAIILSDGENLALEDVTVVPDYRTELRHA
jgi:aryl-alcohol dehydrogenase-like predicted oxidoreductase